MTSFKIIEFIIKIKLLQKHQSTQFFTLPKPQTLIITQNHWAKTHFNCCTFTETIILFL